MSDRARWGLCLIALGLGGMTAAAPQPDRLAPGDANLLISVNVRQALSAPLVKKYALAELQKALKRDERVAGALAAAGLDPLRDLDSVTVTVAGDLPHPRIFAVLRGRFDPEKMADIAVDFSKKYPDTLQIGRLTDRAVYQFKAEKQPFFAAFAARDAAVLATSRDDLAGVLTGATKAPAALSPRLKQALGKVDGGESAWLAAVITNQLKEKINERDPQSAELAAGLEAITATIEVTDGLKVIVVAHTRSAEAAESLYKKAEELLPILQFFAAGKDTQARALQEAVRNIKISTDKSSVRLVLQVTEEMIQKAARTKGK